MKNLFALLLVLITASGSLSGQEKALTFIRAGLNTDASFNNFTARVQIEPYLAIGNLRKQLVVGPTLLIASNIGFATSNMPRLSGLKIGYRYWPGSLDKQWSFYLTNELRVQRVQEKWQGNFFDDQSLAYQDRNYRTVEVLIDNFTGYGVSFKINNKLSLNQGVGIGMYLSNLKGSNSQDTPANFDYRGYGDFGFSWKVNFGLAYDL